MIWKLACNFVAGALLLHLVQPEDGQVYAITTILAALAAVGGVAASAAGAAGGAIAGAAGAIGSGLAAGAGAIGSAAGAAGSAIGGALGSAGSAIGGAASSLGGIFGGGAGGAGGALGAGGGSIAGGVGSAGSGAGALGSLLTGTGGATTALAPGASSGLSMTSLLGGASKLLGGGGGGEKEKAAPQGPIPLGGPPTTARGAVPFQGVAQPGAPMNAPNRGVTYDTGALDQAFEAQSSPPVDEGPGFLTRLILGGEASQLDPSQRSSAVTSALLRSLGGGIRAGMAHRQGYYDPGPSIFETGRYESSRLAEQNASAADKKERRDWQMGADERAFKLHERTRKFNIEHPMPTKATKPSHLETDGPEGYGDYLLNDDGTLGKKLGGGKPAAPKSTKGPSFEAALREKVVRYGEESLTAEEAAAWKRIKELKSSSRPSFSFDFGGGSAGSAGDSSPVDRVFK